MDTLELSFDYYNCQVRKGVLILLLVLSPALVSCGESTNKFATIQDLRDAFVKAGAQCWEFKEERILPQIKTTHKASASCDQKSRLIIYTENTDSMQQALDFAKFMRSLDYKLNILVGDNWFINSDQVTLVSEKMGGTLITR